MRKALTVVKLMLSFIAAFVLIYYVLTRSHTVTISKDVTGMRQGKRKKKGVLAREQTRFSLIPLKVGAKSGKVRDFKQGAVVAYRLSRAQDRDGLIRAARVIARAGQRVAIERGEIQVDGKPYNARTAITLRRMEIPEILIPRDCVYLLADMRGRELDSWKVGPIAIHCILGELEVGP